MYMTPWSIGSCLALESHNNVMISIKNIRFIFMISNPHVLSLHHQELSEMALRRDPSRAGKGIATTEISDASSAPTDAQREQTPPVITMEEFRMMREEMRELRIENQALRKEMAREIL